MEALEPHGAQGSRGRLSDSRVLVVEASRLGKCVGQDAGLLILRCLSPDGFLGPVGPQAQGQRIGVRQAGRSSGDKQRTPTPGK